jgi:hypothetical protein
LISYHYFFSANVFSSGLRSSAFIVIASAGRQHTTSGTIFYLVRHVLIGVDHGKPDSFHVPVQGIEW